MARTRLRASTGGQSKAKNGEVKTSFANRREALPKPTALEGRSWIKAGYTVAYAEAKTGLTLTQMLHGVSPEEKEEIRRLVSGDKRPARLGSAFEKRPPTEVVDAIVNGAKKPPRAKRSPASAKVVEAVKETPAKKAAKKAVAKKSPAKPTKANDGIPYADLKAFAEKNGLEVPAKGPFFKKEVRVAFMEAKS